MEININNKKVKIEFRHSNHKITICNIITPEKSFVGVAEVSPKDQFCKETGRKVSLTKALNISNFSREDRKQIWETYRNWGKKRF